MKMIRTEIEIQGSPRDMWDGWQIRILTDREIPSFDRSKETCLAKLNSSSPPSREEARDCVGQ